MLGFDIPTFVFQIINFLILLAILTRFFYRPVLDVMQKRQAQIDERIEDAERRGREADEARVKLAQQSEAAAREAATMLETARSQAGKERERLIEAAKKDAAALVDAARATATTEEKAAMERVGQRLSQSAVNIAGSLVRQSSGEAVHNALIERLLSEGLGFQEEARQEAAEDLHKDANKIVVQSAYPLEAAQEQSLRGLIGKTLDLPPDEVVVEVREAPELLAGARILLGAHVVDMTLLHQLEMLSEQEGGAA